MLVESVNLSVEGCILDKSAVPPVTDNSKASESSAPVPVLEPKAGSFKVTSRVQLSRARLSAVINGAF